MGQVKFVEDTLQNVWRDMVCLGRPYLFKFYKGCFPQVFLGLFLNTWSHLYRNKYIFDICQEIINHRIKIKKVILAGVLVEIYPIDFNIANPRLIFSPPAEFCVLRDLSGNYVWGKRNHFPKPRHNVYICLS